MNMPRLLIVAALTLVGAGAASAQQRGIINNADSPHVAFRSVDMGDCRWTGGFWGQKLENCAAVMVPHMGTLLKGEVGHGYNNFKIAAGLMEGAHQGEKWHDGDFYKWMEAATHVYAQQHDEAVRTELDEIIGVIAQAQRPDGYLSTYNLIRGVTPWTHRQDHELYNSGHLLTAACIHHRVTGQSNFLDIAVRHADYLHGLFASRPDGLKRFGFNQSQIMGLVELYRTVGDKRYLELAETFINMREGTRGRPAPDSTASPYAQGDMVQERVPLRRAREAVGHAVLALYFYAGAADVYAETGEQDLIDALDRLWTNVTEKKMYVTGACGQGHHGVSSRVDLVHEAFLDAYAMPNASAYNETCANIANAMFSYRLLGVHGDAKYADVMELALYNSVLSGVSAEGTHYFYTNPLRRTADQAMGKTDQRVRAAYIDCFCCPPNAVRTIAKVAGWAYSLTDDGVAVNLYGDNTLDTTMLDGSELRLTQASDYPWEGGVALTIDACRAEPFAMRLRIPAWLGDDAATLSVNGEPVDVDRAPGTYAVVARAWKPGDVLTLALPLEIKLLTGHPRIEAVRNQAAVKRGPVVYCLETPDLPEGTSVLDVYLRADAELKPEKDSAFADGLTTLRGELLVRPTPADQMYTPLETAPWKTIETQLVPYYAWSNRGEAEMSVWLPLVWGDAR